MKIGDLVRIKPENRSECLKGFGLGSSIVDTDCPCWFCCHKSSGVGIITQQGDNARFIDNDGLTVHSLEWTVLFDAGYWEVYESEIEVVDEGSIQITS